MNEIEQGFFNEFVQYAKQEPVFCTCADLVDEGIQPKIATCQIFIDKDYSTDDELVMNIPTKMYRICPDFDDYDFSVCLKKQYSKGPYIVDFALVSQVMPFIDLGIEIDGHEWHEKNKEQAARDKRRDRELLLMNMPIVRFTGSEIYTNSQKCIIEALNIFISQSYSMMQTNPIMYMQVYNENHSRGK